MTFGADREKWTRSLRYPRHGHTSSPQSLSYVLSPFTSILSQNHHKTLSYFPQSSGFSITHSQPILFSTYIFKSDSCTCQSPELRVGEEAAPSQHGLLWAGSRPQCVLFGLRDVFKICENYGFPASFDQF